MLEELKNIKEYSFEEKNSFSASEYPCFYQKKEFGYIVFFIISDESIDYAVYNSKKKLISLVDNINLMFENEKDINWTRRFLVDNSSENKDYVQYLIDNNPFNS